MDGETDDIEDKVREMETGRGEDGPTTEVCEETDGILNEEITQRTTKLSDDDEFCGIRLRSRRKLAVSLYKRRKLNEAKRV